VLCRQWRISIPAMALPALGNTCLFYLTPLAVAGLVGAPGRRRGQKADVERLIVQVRREREYGPARIAAVLRSERNPTVAPATVHRVLMRHGINRLRDLDPPTGEQLRAVIRYEHDKAGALVHVDVKKLGRIWPAPTMSTPRPPTSSGSPNN
jgi:hypothetical protein